MTIIFCILAFVAGLIAGVMLMAMMASKKIDNINRIWYEACLRITDGEDVKTSISKIFTEEVDKHE